MRYRNIRNALKNTFNKKEPTTFYKEKASEIDMCKALENLVNNIKREEKKETVLRLSEMGMPVEQIAKAVRSTIENVQNWLQESTQQ